MFIKKGLGYEFISKFSPGISKIVQNIGGGGEIKQKLLTYIVL